MTNETPGPGTQQAIDYKATFEALPGNFLVLKPDHPAYTILAISEELLRITARERDKVVGKSVFEVYPENPAAITATGPSTIKRSLRNALKKKAADPLPIVRYDVPNAAGVFEERYWSANTKPVLDAAGEVLYLIHATTDVTDQVMAEKTQRAFRDIEKNYNLFLQAPVAVCIVTGSEHVVELANEEMLRFFGRTSEIIGKPFLEAMPGAKAQGYVELLDQVRKTGEPFYAAEYPAAITIQGKEELRYYDFVCQPYYENPADKVPAGVFTVVHHVTEQVVARKKVEASEHRYRILIEEAPVATALYIGPDIRIQYANDIMLGYWGKGQEVIGKPFREALQELHAQPFPDLKEHVYATGEPYVGTREKADLVVDGRLQSFYFNFTYKPVRNERGEIYGLHHMAIDVTQEVLAQTRMEESEQQLRSFVESAPFPIGVYVGKDMRIQFANKAILDAWGKGNDVINKRYADVLPELENQEIFGQLDGVFTTGIPFHARTQRVDLVVAGRPKPYYFNYSFTPLFDAAGKVYGVMNTAADVTDLALAHQQIEAVAAELKESEERFRIMADAAPNIIWAINPDGTVKYVNKFYLVFLGLPLEAFIADNWMAYVHPEDLALARQTLGEAIQNRKIFSLEHRMRRHDGEYRWMLAQGAPSFYPNGELYGYVGSAIDITAMKAAEVEMEAKNVQLTRINNDLDNFVYTASHDLRSPITTIEGLMDLLKEELQESNCLNEGLQGVLQRVITSVSRLKITIQDLTEISRLQHDIHETLAEESVTVQEVYEDIWADLGVGAPLLVSHIHTDFQVPQLTFSRKNFRSILYNLLSNAIKYQSPERPCDIRIHTRLEGPYFVLSVKDNGLGMTERQQAKLYTMFKRFHDHVEGTGVGLYMVKRIIENAGGKIEVSSAVDMGTEFRVYLIAA